MITSAGARWVWRIGGVAVALVALAAIWLLLVEARPPLRPALELASVLAALAALLGLAGVLQRRRRRLARVLESVRELSAGELDAAGADELAVLTAALRALRGRLAAQERALAAERALRAALLDRLEEGVLAADADGRIVLANRAAVRLLDVRPGPDGLAGCPVETCLRQHALQRLLLGPAAGGGAGAAERGTAGEPEPGSEGAGAAADLQIDTAGGPVQLRVRGMPVLLPGGGGAAPAAGRMVVLTDVTELRRTVALRSDFVANASHELRTPLATIRAAVEALLGLDLAREAAAARSFLEKIERHADRLQQMVADLLDLSRLEAPTERFEPEPLDVPRLLQELHFRFAEAAERRGVSWEAVCEPPELRSVHANPHLVRLVLDNLVDNAIKFTERGGHVRVRVARAGAAAVLEVRDDGCGIPEEDQARVFERFFQVQRSRSGPERGTGLGLSIVRHAVEALHGDVRLESAPGRGTRVTVTLPQPEADGQRS